MLSRKPHPSQRRKGCGLRDSVRMWRRLAGWCTAIIMGKTKKSFYAVRRGRSVGVYNSWWVCSQTNCNSGGGRTRDITSTLPPPTGRSVRCKWRDILELCTRDSQHKKRQKVLHTLARPHLPVRDTADTYHQQGTYPAVMPLGVLSVLVSHDSRNRTNCDGRKFIQQLQGERFYLGFCCHVSSRSSASGYRGTKSGRGEYKSGWDIVRAVVSLSVSPTS